MQASGLWYVASKHMIEEGTCARPLEFMLGKIGNLNRANILSHGGDFGGHIIMRARSAESRVFMGIIGISREPPSIFQTIRVAHYSPARYEPVIKSCCLLPPSFWQGLVRKRHDKTAFVIFR